MKSKKFNVHVEYENINEDHQFSTVNEICDFLGITKGQYVGLRSNRTKCKREYNDHLNKCVITKIEQPKKKEVKKREKINIHNIINKVHSQVPHVDEQTVQ